MIHICNDIGESFLFPPKKGNYATSVRNLGGHEVSAAAAVFVHVKSILTSAKLF